MRLSSWVGQWTHIQPIAVNLYSQVDTEGKQYQVLSEIIDHRTNGHAVSIDDVFITDKYGNQHRYLMERPYNIMG
jgi:hypothetical protein